MKPFLGLFEPDWHCPTPNFDPLLPPEKWDGPRMFDGAVHGFWCWPDCQVGPKVIERWTPGFCADTGSAYHMDHEYNIGLTGVPRGSSLNLDGFYMKLGFELAEQIDWQP